MDALDRRTLLAGFAGAGLAGAGLAALPRVPAQASDAADPIIDIYGRARAAHAATRGLGEKDMALAVDRLIEIEHEGIESSPTTVEGAIAGLEWALWQHEENSGEDDIVRTMIGGALDVLRRLSDA